MASPYTERVTDAATHASTETGPEVGDTQDAPTAPAVVERPGSLPTEAERAAAAKDKTLTSPVAVDLARQMLGQFTDPVSVGEHVGFKLQAERLVTHFFDCNLAGYLGWRWAVTVARPPRSRTATVCEMELLPGEEALLAPAWVPWVDRLRPGDFDRSERNNDGDSRHGSGRHGIAALDPEEAATPEALGLTFGFFPGLSGVLQDVFGLRTGQWASDEGRQVEEAADEPRTEAEILDQGFDWPVAPTRLDETAMESLGTDGTSLRGGRTLEEARASGAGDATGEAGDVSGDAADAANAEGAEPSDDVAGATDGADAEGSADAETQDEAESAADVATPADSGDSGDSEGSADAGNPEDCEDRVAAARDAVADLRSQLGTRPREHAEDREEGPGLAALAELEAQLPRRS